MRSVVALAAALLSACSGIKTYPNELPKNLSVQTKASSGSVFQSLNVSLNLHSVDEKCQTAYLGTIALDRPVVAVGVPTQGQVYLEFIFDKSARFYSSSSSIDYGTLMRLRSGHQYVADVSYADELYKVTVRDRSAGNAIVERQSLENCARKGR